MCGPQRNLPKKLLHGPISNRGCGPPDLCTLQAAHHLSVILRHDLKDAHTHNLLQDNVETVQFYVGSDQNFWELPFPLHGKLAPKGWVWNTWEAIDSTNLRLWGRNIATPIRREHDTHLMDAFFNLQDVTDAQINSLQRC